MNDEHDQIEALLNRALEFKPAERQAFLAGACGSDHVIREKVETLLRAAAEADGFMESITTLDSSPLTEGPGTVIGRYKLLQMVGEGGMGVVYMAEQTQPVIRKVALKIIKLGMDTKQVVARFEAERQALAMMDHPNIAKVLDGGTTETGRPYFVMELVQGVPIVEFCDKARLPAKERLKLFIQVCQAVQSAHQKGVIHRDLKPSNILVTLHHGEPMPKVIDFGIAKATNQKLTEKTLFTNYATMIGTPAYMSPEQAEMTSMDVDTRTDIYSLGVLLYELLTGSTPFPEKRLRSLGYGEMQRVIVDEEPDRPSTRLSTLEGDQKSAVAKNRGEELAALSKLLRGDLDWIVMRCLEKDRTRRYETANGLAADIQRHLDNEPVVARPPSAAYKFQKAWRRNKLLFAAGTAVALALVLGVIGTTAGLVRAERQRRAAQAAEQEQNKLREVAVKALEGEKQQSAQADAARRKAQAEAYAADINLAGQALAENNLGHARRLLARHRPTPGQADLRGWEWRYLWQQTRGDSPLKIFTEPPGHASVELSRDGRWLAVLAMFGKSIYILDLADPQTPRVVAQPPAGPMNHVQSLSPVDPVLAYDAMENPAFTNSSKVHLWNFLSRTNVATLPLPGPCIGLRFSSDGRQLLTLTGRHQEALSELTLWNVGTGTAMSRHPASADYSDELTMLAATADLRLAAYCGSSNTLQVVDVASGTNVWTSWLASGSDFFAVAISRDDKVLVAASIDKSSRRSVLHRWELATGREIGAPLSTSAPSIVHLRFLDAGNTLASAGSDHAIHLWDLSDPQTIREKGRPWLGSESAVVSIVGLPDGKSLISGAADGSVHRWDVSAERPDPGQVTLAQHDQGQAAPDGRSVFLVERTNQVVQRHAPRFEAKTDLLELPDNARHTPFFSRDCRLLVTTSTNGVLHLWDLQERRLIRAFGSHTSGVHVLEILPHRKKLVLHDNASQNLEEWDLETFQMTRVLSAGLGENICASLDEAWLLKSEFEGRFSLINLATQEVTTRQLPIGQVTSVRFSDDGRRFAASSYLGYAGVWETATFRQIGSFGDRAKLINVRDLTQDGTRLLTSADSDIGATLWDVETQRALIRFPDCHYGEFSPDGNLLGFGIEFGKGGGKLRLFLPPSLAEIDALEAKEKAAVNRP